MSDKEITVFFTGLLLGIVCLGVNWISYTAGYSDAQKIEKGIKK